MAQQKFKVLEPSVVDLDLSPEGEARFKRDSDLYPSVVRNLDKVGDIEKLSAEEQRIYSTYDETKENYWHILGDGCSWYCGGGAKEITASSTLKPQGNVSYDPGNAEDLDYRTAWVEGVPGYGIGQYLLYTFAPEAPRITEIIVVNGYVKSERAYLENSRVKKLKVYLNNEPYLILNLEDKRSSQSFAVLPIGNGNRDSTEDYDKLKTLKPWTLKFEIAEVYKGTKYDDVVITEIYFDGIDVH